MALYATLKLKSVNSALVTQTIDFTSPLGEKFSLSVYLAYAIYAYPRNLRK